MKKVIGIIGPIASGKDILADYIGRRLGISVCQISDALKAIAKERGIPLYRETLIKLGTSLAAEKGDDFLARYLLSQNHDDLMIISGMRQLGQIAYLRRSSRLILISVDASPEQRFVWAKERGKLGESGTLQEFIAKEKAENSGSNAQRLFECMKLADHSILNDGSLDELYRKADQVLVVEGLV